MTIRRYYYPIFISIIISGLLTCQALAQEEAGKGKPLPREEAGKGKAAPPQEQPAPQPTAAIMEIKPVSDKEQLYSVELRDVDIRDLFRLLAQDYKLNLLIDKDVKGTVTASFNNISIEDMLNAIAQSNNLALQKDKNIIKITPDLITRVFVLNNVEAKKITQPQQGAPAAAQPQAAPGAAQGAVANASTIFDLLSEKGKVLLGDQPNSIMVIDYPANVAKIEEYLKVADQKMVARVFKLKYISVTDIFPEVVDKDRDERKKQRDERQQETDEIKSLQPQ